MSLRLRHSRVALGVLAASTIASGAACARDADSARQTPALVLLRQQLRFGSPLPVSRVRQPDDTTLRLVLEEATRAELRPAQRDSMARIVAMRTALLWPDPALKTIEVVVDRQQRLGPFTYRVGESRFRYDAAALAPPPPIPGAAPTAIPLPATDTPVR